jgi:hypothetical protein
MHCAKSCTIATGWFFTSGARPSKHTSMNAMKICVDESNYLFLGLIFFLDEIVAVVKFLFAIFF